MVKVSIYINKHLQFLVKTNMDLQERQEEALDSKDKTKNIKEKNSKEKEIKNSINNLLLESNEKSQEEKINNSNINNNDNINNNIKDNNDENIPLFKLNNSTIPDLGFILFKTGKEVNSKVKFEMYLGMMEPPTEKKALAEYEKNSKEDDDMIKTQHKAPYNGLALYGEYFPNLQDMKIKFWTGRSIRFKR